ncbi:N-acyl amino acid synthase FeeM domain-containing protein [Roseicyclus sp.]|uniref:N-acyl amino acid synthase FeeM domain-containing protein n=1 Tax=Roseicyclus sp. TaxID=1914329 RepID=UPI003F9EE8A2
MEALKRSRYKVVSEGEDLEAIYRLRYKCYRAEGSIPENELGMMSDPFDETDNCVQIGVEMDGELLASVRLHLVSKLSPVSPTLEVFPELHDYIERGQTILDPTRFAVDPEARKHRVKLNFLTLRVPFIATIFYDIDIVLAPVRAEHAAFYRRYLGAKPATGLRSYPGLKRPVQLLTTDVRAERDGILERTPFFGPVAEIPNANIAFPSLSGVYVASRRGRSDAA